MSPFTLGLTFGGLTRTTDGRLSTRLVGHGFRAEPAHQLDPWIAEADSAILLMSNPNAAVTHCRQSQPVPTGDLRVSWARLVVHAVLALGDVDAEFWGIQQTGSGTKEGLRELNARLDTGGLEALVAPADQSGVHRVVVARTRYRPPWVQTIAQWVVDGDSADFNDERLAMYPSNLRRRQTPSRLVEQSSQSVHVGAQMDSADQQASLALGGRSKGRSVSWPR